MIITTGRALVVTVRRKYTPAELAASSIEELPTTFGGLKVQVTDPKPHTPVASSIEGATK